MVVLIAKGCFWLNVYGTVGNDVKNYRVILPVCLHGVNKIDGLSIAAFSLPVYADTVCSS